MVGKTGMIAAAAGIAGFGASIWAFAQAPIDGLQATSDAATVNYVDQMTIDLAEAFPAVAAAQGRTMRARKIIVDAGGITPVQSHKDSPGITYVTGGRIVEHRSDAQSPIEHIAGAVTFDKGGVEQWWENTGDAPATLYIVDIAPPEGAAAGL